MRSFIIQLKVIVLTFSPLVDCYTRPINKLIITITFFFKLKPMQTMCFVAKNGWLHFTILAWNKITLKKKKNEKNYIKTECLLSNSKISVLIEMSK